MGRPTATTRRLRALVAAATVALVSCGGNDPEPGSIRFALTDAPACGFDQVVVTIERIRVHRDAGAGVNAVGWSELRLEPARRVDLLKLYNGVIEELGSLSLSASRYAQFRLVLAGNGSGTPSNSVVPTGASETALTLPADAASGIKVVSQVTVDKEKTTDVLFDFDACRSVVPSGNGYLLSPAVRTVPRNSIAITGYVDPQLAGAAISAQKAGVVQRSTVADANGRFVLAYLDPARSPFDVAITADGRVTAVVSGVSVTPTAGAELSRMDAPITLPAATDREAGGTVGPVAARGDAVVRALQSVGSSTQVEVSTTNADAFSGSYSLSLPAAQPRLAAYATQLPLAFAAAGTAGLYTLEASASGYETLQQLIDVSASGLTWSPTLLRQ